MANKKVTVEEFNKDFFNEWTKIKKITPHFVEWSTHAEDPEDFPANSWNEIEKIDIEFDNGSKISIVPKSNRDDVDLDDEENPLCLALEIVQFKPETVNWRVKK